MKKKRGLPIRTAHVHLLIDAGGGVLFGTMTFLPGTPAEYDEYVCGYWTQLILGKDEDQLKSGDRYSITFTVRKLRKRRT